MLEYRHLLVRHYTQNIDSLASNTTMDRNHLVELHGSFDSAHCLVCGMKYKKEDYEQCVKEGILSPSRLHWIRSRETMQFQKVHRIGQA